MYFQKSLIKFVLFLKKRKLHKKCLLKFLLQITLDKVCRTTFSYHKNKMYYVQRNPVPLKGLEYVFSDSDMKRHDQTGIPSSQHASESI
jgi:hypothetical protein